MTGPTSGQGRWLIDGNNVMGSRPDGWWRDRVGAKARLAAQVADWAEATERSVILVFDGRTDDRILAAAAGAGVSLHFADGRRPGDADDLIVELARSGDIVVTADRGLTARLALGVTTVGPTSLLAELGRSGERRTN